MKKSQAHKNTSKKKIIMRKILLIKLVIVVVSVIFITSNAFASIAELILHYDGIDGSTTFTDSTTRHTITAYQQAQIDTAQSKFGGASGLFDGTGDYVAATDNLADFNFGTDPFTVDFWVRFNTTAAGGTLYWISGGGELSFYPNVIYIINPGVIDLRATWTPSTNT